MSIIVRPAYQNEWEEVMQLAWRTFLKYDACDYTEEGIQNFRDFVTDETLYKMFLMGNYQVFVALSNERIVGMISLRNKTHISLLFVDEEYQWQGIGRHLIRMAWRHVITTYGRYDLTVDSSPYGVDFYHHIGFGDIDKEQTRSGIRYTPMEFNGEILEESWEDSLT